MRRKMPVRKVRKQILRGRKLPIRLEVRASDSSGNRTSARRVFKICGAGKR
jgi:hypothetical protein